MFFVEVLAFVIGMSGLAAFAIALEGSQAPTGCLAKLGLLGAGIVLMGISAWLLD